MKDNAVTSRLRTISAVIAAAATLTALSACNQTQTPQSTQASQEQKQVQQQHQQHADVPPPSLTQPTQQPQHEQAQQHHQQQTQTNTESLKTPAQPNPRPFRPHVRLDATTRTVEFDGIVPIAVGQPGSPVVYLELIACTPDTKEHESLVMTDARPSDIHAALLLTGLQPGSPAKFRWDGTDLHVIQPEGPPVNVTLIWTTPAGQQNEDHISQWVTSEDTGERFNAENKPWLFAGSNLREHQGRTIYEADFSGCVVGLTTFGSELLAFPIPISPDSAIVPPEWIADPARVPPAGTPVTVRLRAADQTQKPR